MEELISGGGGDDVEDRICGELEDKVNSLNEYVNEVKGEVVIQVRVQ